MKKRVLICSTYPVSHPRHGGQLRTSATIEKLSDAGFDVQHFALFDHLNYGLQALDTFNISITPEFRHEISHKGWRSDIDASEFFFMSDDNFLLIANAVRIFDPHVIMLNQPWLWPAIKAAVWWLRMDDSTSIVYASQNVEADLLDDAPAGGTRSSDRHRQKVELLEEDLAKSANLVVCVSARDAGYYRQFSRNVVISPNGISPRVAPGGLDFWSTFYRGKNLALMVGSAHPPNADGFNTMLAPNLAFLAPDERIVVVGGAGAIIPQDARFRKFHGVNSARIDFIGVQDEGGLSSFIEISNLLILPITSGGGTNIKTAEALFNRKTIVATSVAFRGYESFTHLPFVHIADTPDLFRSKLKSAMNSSKAPHAVSEEEEMLLGQLTWSSALDNLPSALLNL